MATFISFLCVQLFFLISAGQAQEVGAPQWAVEMMDLINNARSQAKLDPLCLNSKLMSASIAFAQASDPSPGAPLVHEGRDGSLPDTRARALGLSFTAITENLASPDSVRGAFERLMASDAHRMNIMSNAPNIIGLGGTSNGNVHEGIWVQKFARSAEGCDVTGGGRGGEGGGGNSTGNANSKIPPPASGDPPKSPDLQQRYQKVMSNLAYFANNPLNMSATAFSSASAVLTVLPLNVENTIIDGGSFTVDGGILNCPPCNTKLPEGMKNLNFSKCKCIEVNN